MNICLAEMQLVAVPNSLVAEIYCNGRFMALVSQERGKCLFDIEIPTRNCIESEMFRKVEVEKFIAAIQAACQRLKGEN